MTHEYKRNSQSKNEESQQDHSGNKNQFRLSNYAPHFGESLSIIQIENVNRIAQLQVQNKISTIFDIFELKVLNRIDHAFSQLKVAEDPYLSLYAQQKIMLQLGNSFVQKLQHFLKAKASKNMFSFLTNLKIMSNKSRNQNSKREMMRVNSRVDRDYDDFELLDRNNSHQGNSEKTNKMLMKKKEKNEKQVSLFKLQMEQLMSQHQGYLKKKN